MLMKKLLLSIVSAFIVFSLSAQVSEDFSDYTVGEKIAQQAQEMGRTYWTTWNDKPGTNEDGTVGEIDGNKCGKFEWMGNNGIDQILKLGGKTSGTWELSFKAYIPTGQCGFFNILADFDGPRSKWAFQVYFSKNGNAPGIGTMDADGSDAASFTFSHDTWIPVKLNMNLDADEASIYINDNLIHSWTYTNGAFGLADGGCPRAIDALDIYPTTAGKSTFYIDDIVFEPIGEPTFPIINVTPDAISETVSVGTTITKTITVENTGSSIGDYLSWISFGEGEDGATQNLTLTYSNEEYSDGGVGFSDLEEDTWVQIATKFPVSYFCDKIGTYITKLSYYIGSNFGNNDPLIFRIYGPQIDNSGPGKLLMETSLETYSPDMWNDVTLPEPFLLDGREIWLSVQFTHSIGAYPIACDLKAVPAATNWIRYANYSWSDWGSDYGDFMIKGLLEGKTTPACWLSLSGNTYGSVSMGSTKVFNVVINTTGLEAGEYESTIMVETNDEDNPLFMIPCTITIFDAPVMSVNPTSINKKITNPDDIITIEMTITNSGSFAGDYTVAESTVDWLSLSGNISGTVEPGSSSTFDVILSIDSTFANATYNTTIEISLPGNADELITVPCTLVVEVLGVGEYQIHTILFPNPANDNVTTVQSSQNINSIQVINFVGQTVYSSIVNNTQTSINTSNLSSGIYFVRVNTDAGSQSVKLIVK